MEKKAATSSSNATPRISSRKSDISSKKLCQNCKSLLSSDNMLSLIKLCKFYEDIYNGILKFEKSLAVINDRAENASISLDLIKAESISKLECLELSIYIIIPKCACVCVCVCVCVCLCTFYLKTVNGNGLILFAS